jgi:pyruvate dehydrogenase E1 component alpha subunit
VVEGGVRLVNHTNGLRELMLDRRTAISKDRVERYRRMVEIRVFEDTVQQLFLEGHVDGTTHTCQGQEAVAVGVAAALQPSDTVACTYRGHGVALALGLDAESIMAEILGRTRGCTGGLGGSMHLSNRDIGLFPTVAIVGAGVPMAAGFGLTSQVLGTDDIGVAICGDGATNIGAFHEGVNLAAIWKLPAVFVVENNVYGEYSRFDKTTPIENLADRAGSYGIPGLVIDGQDVDAVERATAEAANRARAGEGPTLLEMKTYRYAGHSRSDQALYRPPGELDAWKARDPLDIFKVKLVEEGVVTEGDLDQVRADAQTEMAEVADRVLAMPKTDADDMFRNIFASADRQDVRGA